MGALQFAVMILLAVAAEAAPRAAEDPLPFDLDEVLDGSFSARGLGAVWVSPSHLARRISSGDIQIYNFPDGANYILVTNELLSEKGRNVTTGSWQLSPDSLILLWSYEVEAGFRHSTEAKYSVLDIHNKIWHDLHDGKHLQTAQLSPKGNSVAYVYENNIYYVEDILTPLTRKALTEDGSDFIYNGVPDWVYEEEVLSSGSAMWFSPKGEYLAYGKFNDSEVEEFSYIVYGQGPYTTVEKLRYPKPGTENPTVLVSVSRLSDNETVTLDSAKTEYEEPILQHVAWTSEDQVLVVWLNRIQNDVTIVSYNTSKSQVESEIEYKMSEDKGWLDVGSPRPVNDTAWAMLWPLEMDGERFQKVVIFNNSEVNNRVSDKSVATAFYGWNTVTEHIFFQAAPAGQPGQRHVYSASDNGPEHVTCLTCALVQPFNGSTLCLYASASFSSDLSLAAFTCSGPGPAFVQLAEISSDGGVTWLQVWEDNADLLTKLDGRTLPDVEANIIFEVGDGIQAQARLWLPPNIDREKKYPMVVYVYGGPGSQQVSNAYSVNWGYYLTTSNNIIYASIDGRGSGYQGSKTLYALYKNLGTVEVEDQIGVTKQLVQHFDFIDEERIGIWGWSYGGYATAMALALDNANVFRCGASVAPVTSWDLYDTIYTERYMDELDANKAGYEKANVSNNIENFKTHQFFLLHGNADDNVHYQQAMRFARVLEENNVLFAQQSYPDENHSIRSVLKHVYLSLGDFFEKCFEPPSPPAPPTAQEETTTDSGSARALAAIFLALLLPLAVL